ncbi:hypothetical protein CARUB_v10005900mg [Capsella rubella]|uniref:NYN domain-containing protein n=1 Tax=Capsella rubella TaxID=81985 RepID=R0GTK1_9BRAS|nr:uncharacterized protein LOC17880944 [Capsella rubella]EOA15645.1 hypothetical protein CARUB_v10005900mg [Capsella rubella]
MSQPTSERFFPPPTTRLDGSRLTMVYWVIDDGPIPSLYEIWKAYDKIGSYLAHVEEFRGGSKLEVYFLKPAKVLPKEYWDHYEEFMRIKNGKEGKGVRFERMLLDILVWSLLEKRNYLIISSNKDFGHGTKFNTVRDTLKEKGITVTVAHPDFFINLDPSFFDQFGIP